MAIELPSADRLRSLFEYLPTGDLVFLPREGSPHFNAMYAGCVVAKNTSRKGYSKLKVDGRFVFAHRVIWKMHHGDDPHQIDHINGDRADNRIENLRAAVGGENNRASRRNTSATGFKGVIRASRSEKFEARIKLNGKQRHLGTYPTANDAARAYDAAAVEMHGSFAVTNASLGLV